MVASCSAYAEQLATYVDYQARALTLGRDPIRRRCQTVYRRSRVTSFFFLVSAYPVVSPTSSCCHEFHS